jgi:hypothetical protein
MHHIPLKKIEDLALGKLSTQESLVVQRHLYHCGPCLQHLVEITFCQEALGLGPTPLAIPNQRIPLYMIHDTADGLIYSKVDRRGGKWVARHWGEQLDGGKECATMREANDFLVEAFQQMFPEHRCTEICQVNPRPRKS